MCRRAYSIPAVQQVLALLQFHNALNRHLGFHYRNMNVTIENTKAEQTNTMRDYRGIPVSYSDKEAIDALEHAHESYLAFRGDPIEEINGVIEQHPRFILAHLFKAAYLTQIMESRICDDLIDSVNAANDLAADANEREIHHLRAVSAWAEGDIFGAVREWEKALAEFPHDLLALQLVHLTHVLFGNVAGQRDVVASVFDLWNDDMTGFEFVLGFYAFGLEENRDFERAEQMAMDAMRLRAADPYAVHAVCHVMDMQGRQPEGLRFMYEHVESWSASGFAIHLWWHTALLHLYLQDFEQVLDIYDNKLRSSWDEECRFEEFDATALLWRLKLADVDVGKRWSELADKWAPSAQDMLYAFNNVHAMMAFAADSRDKEMHLLLTAGERCVEQSTGATVAAMRDIGLPFCKAIRDFQDGNYSACVDRLLPVGDMVHLLGGSFVQRDVVGWTMLEAAIRAGNFTLALELANQRCDLTPASPCNWINISRAHAGLGQVEMAEEAQKKAQSLLAS